VRSPLGERCAIRCVDVLDLRGRRRSAAGGAHGAEGGGESILVEDFGWGGAATGVVRRWSDGPFQSGVSTPLLLMPLGMVLAGSVVLLSRVTGRPVVKRAMPATGPSGGDQ